MLHFDFAQWAVQHDKCRFCCRETMILVTHFMKSKKLPTFGREFRLYNIMNSFSSLPQTFFLPEPYPFLLVFERFVGVLTLVLFFDGDKDAVVFYLFEFPL